jgi:beta-glucanase (GH16 family)
MMKYLNTALAAIFLLASCSDDTGPLNVGDPRLVVYNLSFDEMDEDHDIIYYVRLYGDNTTGIPVDYRTRDGSAMASSDYVAAEGQLVFEPGETKKEIAITLLGDNQVEIKKSFTLEFSSPFGEFDPVEGEITIINDDVEDNSGMVVIPETGYTTPDSYPGLTLVWKDEFDQTSLNTGDWSFDTGTGCPNLCGWGNNELQYYQEDNLSLVEDDYLVIEARRQSVQGNSYTSSRINTKNKQEFQYGRIDMRAALPEGKGLWPALWMLGSNIDAVSWPACGEIDIMEIIGSLPGQLHGTVHYGPSWDQQISMGGVEILPLGRKFSEEFHVFSLIWEEDQMQFLLDDEVYFTFTKAMAGNANYPFNQPFYFIFNVAVGGNWPGSPNAGTPFPQHMIVDYVRVFQ